MLNESDTKELLEALEHWIASVELVQQRTDYVSLRGVLAGMRRLRDDLRPSGHWSTPDPDRPCPDCGDHPWPRERCATPKCCSSLLRQACEQRLERES